MTHRVARRVLLLTALAASLAGCSLSTLVPSVDSTGSGCANRWGAGPRDQGVDETGIPIDGIAGLAPPEAVVVARSRGHVVVFRLDHLNCVCIPPAGYGPVEDGWWGSRGQLYLDLEDVEPQGVKMPDGAGC